VSHDKEILRQSRWLFPAVVFPSAVDHAHTRSWTGQAVLSNTKSALSAASILLTNTELLVKGRILGTRHLRIALADITDASPLDAKQGAVEVRFRAARRSRLARLAMSGQPAAASGRIILNVDEPEVWLDELSRRINRRPPGHP
jgi:hypothetical protein